MAKFIIDAQNQETIAAIDLGSNALRAVIARKIKDGIEVIKSIREPLRLGEDVFTKGLISPEKLRATEDTFIKLFQTFIEHNVSEVRAVATSAMRDAANSAELARRIAKITGIEIETIEGKEEARLIFMAVREKISFKKSIALLMDIGGGSTELIIVRDEEILAAHSFDVGTVRLLGHQPEALHAAVDAGVGEMKNFIEAHLGKKEIDVLVGTGGNLRRVGKLRKKVLSKSPESAGLDEVRDLRETLLKMDVAQRVEKLDLDPSRADVIIPALLLIERLMKTVGAKKILLPPIGLKEGLILSMLPERPKVFLTKD